MKKTIYPFLMKYWDACIASMLVFTLVLLFTHHSGIGISPDSVQYLSAANQIATRFSFTDFNDAPFVLFPLGYPILLAMIKWVSTCSISSFLPILNSILFTVLLFVCSTILRTAIQLSGFLRLMVLLLLACSPALLEVYTMLWSETIFIFISLLFILAAKKYIDQSSYSAVLLLAVIASIGFSVRYVGIVFVLTGGILILFNPQLSIKQKCLHALLLGSIGSSLAIMNILRNAMVSGTYTGVREKAIRTWVDNLQDAGTVLSGWFPMPASYSHLAFVMVLFILVLGFLYFLTAIIQHQYYNRYHTIIAVFILVYTIFMLLIASISRFETLSSRLLSPVFIPIILLLTFWLQKLLKNNTSKLRKLIMIIVILCYSLLQNYQLEANKFTWQGVGVAGIPGYSEDQWTKSPLVSFIKKNRSIFQPILIANANDALYYLTGLQTMALPHKDIPAEIEQFKNYQHFYLVWFFYGENDDLINLPFILQQKKPIASWQFKDGIIYRF